MKKIIYLIGFLIFFVISSYGQNITPAIRYLMVYGNSEKLIYNASLSHSKIDIDSAQLSINQLYESATKVYLQSILDTISCNDCYSTLTASISSPTNNSSIHVGDYFPINTTINGQDDRWPYLELSTTQPGTITFKMGYTGNIYGAYYDISDKTHVEIEVKGTSGWTDLRFRLNSNGTTTFGVNGMSNSSDYVTISIPLSNYTIDKTLLRYIEIQRVSGGQSVDIEIKSIRFTGGGTDLEWFGPSNYNNPHDGTGATYKFLANIVSISQDAVYCDTLYLFVNDTLRNYSVTQPFDFIESVDYVGASTIYTKLVDNHSLINYSDTIILDIYKPDTLTLTMTMASSPTINSLTKAPLKYNKKVAYSLTLDDGLNDAFDYGLPLFEGGYVAEANETVPALYFTDGCGNDVNFTSSLGWNSVSNSSFTDTHIGGNTYMTWDELLVLYDSGWSVLNHSYSHADYEDLPGYSDYLFQVMANDTALQAHTHTATHAPIKTHYFLIPSGDQDYAEPAFDYGYKSIISSAIEFDGYGGNNYRGLNVVGYDIDSSKIHRVTFETDVDNTENVMRWLEIAFDSVMADAGTYFWLNQGTHNVDTGVSPGSKWPLYKYYMQTIESTYGKSGLDNIWVAGVPDIIDYLYSVEGSNVVYKVNGNQIIMKVAVNNYPAHVRKRFLSVILNSNVQINDIQIDFDGNINYNNLSVGNQLINIDWSN